MRTKWKTAAILAALVLSTSASFLRAGPVDPKYIPSDAKWVVHVDVDALASSKMLEMLHVDLKLTGNDKHLTVGMGAPAMSENDLKKLAAIQDALGMKIPDDIHGITLVGQSFDETGVVLIVKAKVDKDRLLGMAKLLPQCVSVMHGDTEILSANKQAGEDSQISGAVAPDGAVIIARTADVVEQALDSAGKSPTASTLLPSADADTQPAVMVYLAANGLAELQKEVELSPIMAAVVSARASIREQGDDVVLNGELQTKDAEAARQVGGALQGVKALATLATLDSNHDKNVEAIALLVSRATITAENTTVTVNIPVAMTLIRDTLQSQNARHHAATRPADDKSIRRDQ